MNQPREERLVARPAALLPEDMLADILARLAPRGLAVARAVCRAWRAAVDGRRLLRVDLLPLSVAGIFINFKSHLFPEYFSRPSTGPRISGEMDYLPPGATNDYLRTYILGQCNGLLLLDLDDNGDHVIVNPATQAWAPVPPPPALLGDDVPDIFYYRNYLVFDPTLSPYYEVISIPHIKLYWMSSHLSSAVKEGEWPPSTCILRVFSSGMNMWEERSFIREGEAQATVLYMRHANISERPYSTYSRGALYVFCQSYFVMRISLSHCKYRAIKPPVSFNECMELYLGKCEKGVYLASYDDCGLLQIWMLDESCGRMEWLSKHNCDLMYVLRHNCCQQASGPWVLQDVNYNFYRDDLFPNNIKESPIEEKDEWDSDSDNVLGNGDRAERHYCGGFSILGFHPFKEVIFFSQSEKRGLAYHWNSFKVQDLGNMYPTEYEYFAEMWPNIDVAFPYTPCWT